uniref:Uncharacterized protein n=1 Tax=Anguilla anguilla TaxID=7936 RepID=A0A0E9S9R3_ANGAN
MMVFHTILNEPYFQTKQTLQLIQQYLLPGSIVSHRRSP